MSSADCHEIEKDISIVKYFSRIYEKSEEYFRILRSKIAEKLSKNLSKIDREIIILEKQ